MYDKYIVKIRISLIANESAEGRREADEAAAL